jgi:hypothetical protein
MGRALVFCAITINPFAQIAHIVFTNYGATELLGACPVDKLAESDFPFDVGSNCIFKVHWFVSFLWVLII